MAKKTIDDIQVAGKRVLVRCDFNVPMQDGKITSDKRIVAALPTIKKLIADGGKVIPVSYTHLDVYKRQGPWRSIRPRASVSGWRRPSRWTHKCRPPPGQKAWSGFAPAGRTRSKCAARRQGHPWRGH